MDNSDEKMVTIRLATWKFLYKILELHLKADFFTKTLEIIKNQKEVSWNKTVRI